MSSATFAPVRGRSNGSLAHHLRVLRVIAGVEFKMKYADSVMGYLWSLAKPLSYFGVLWLVFGHFFRTGAQIPNFPLYLIVGIVFYTFFIDSIAMTLPSIVSRGSILRRIAFPPLIIPLSFSLTALITFLVNLVAVVVFVGASRITPDLDWLLILPLLVELYVFILGLGLILATLYVRFRDILQLWELAAQLLIFATPIMYPISVLPGWAQKIAYCNPFVQIMQDTRALILGTHQPHETVASVLGGSASRLLPVSVAVAVLLVGLALFRHDAPRFAERV